ncbi:MAG: acyl-CoA thioesterase [Deltaproteobacteria bacterium]|nr:MAG: acyl-CoA thioesterase [Deltaproteobacteria bacterium]
MTRGVKSTKSLVRVIFGDTDAMGIAYYANYLKWFEIGRTDLLQALDRPYTAYIAEDRHLPVTECFCRYRAPARYNDLLEIESMLTKISRATLTVSYLIRNHESGQLLAQGYTTHALVDGKGVIQLFDRDFIARMKAFLVETPEITGGGGK